MTNILYTRSCQSYEAMEKTETYLKSLIPIERFKLLHKEFSNEFKRAREIERQISGDTPIEIAEPLFKEWELIWAKIAKSCRAKK